MMLVEEGVEPILVGWIALKEQIEAIKYFLKPFLDHVFPSLGFTFFFSDHSSAVGNLASVPTPKLGGLDLVTHPGQLILGELVPLHQILAPPRPSVGLEQETTPRAFVH
jgi:hypothetical protein